MMIATAICKNKKCNDLLIQLTSRRETLRPHYKWSTIKAPVLFEPTTGKIRKEQDDILLIFVFGSYSLLLFVEDVRTRTKPTSPYNAKNRTPAFLTTVTAFKLVLLHIGKL